MPSALSAFPPITANSLRLTVGNVHSLYVETCGNPSGTPVLVVHGGPGGGINPHMRRYFDPAFWRVVLFDQRGAGQSTPYASIQHNTTDALIDDMEQLRKHLGIERWWLFGGSWGSTLSLLYAQRHPERCMGLILRGIFLSRRRDLQWLYGPNGVAQLYPDAWESFVAGLPDTDLDTVLTHYQQQMAQPDALALPWAKRWAKWEAILSTVNASEAAQASFDARALAISRIENHYFCHQSFITENQILQHCYKLQDIPGFIVQGQLDLVCPAQQAWQLFKHWPQARLHMVAGAGHSASEYGIEQMLLQSVNAARQLTPTLSAG